MTHISYILYLDGGFKVKKFLFFVALLPLIMITGCGGVTSQDLNYVNNNTNEEATGGQLLSLDGNEEGINHVLRIETGDEFWHSAYIPISSLGLEAGYMYQLFMTVYSPSSMTLRLMREILPNTGQQEWALERDWHVAEFMRGLPRWERMTIPLDLRTHADGNIWLRRPYGQDGLARIYIAEITVERTRQEVLRIEFDPNNNNLGFVPTGGASLIVVPEPDLARVPTRAVLNEPTNVGLRVGDVVFTVGRNRGTMNAAPMIIDGIPFIPLCFVGEISNMSMSEMLEEIERDDMIQIETVDGNVMLSLDSVFEFLGTEATWNSTSQVITLTVEYGAIAGMEIEVSIPPTPLQPFRTLEDQRIPVNFAEIIEASYFDLTRAFSYSPLYELFSDFFSLGVAINGINISNASVNSHELAALTAYHFNSVVYSNLMKPDFLIDRTRSMANALDGDETGVAVRFDDALPGLEFARANGLGMRGHTLVWHTQTPEWFFREGFTTNGDFVSREIMIARLESYIRQVLQFTNEYFPGIIYAWDVVNEAVTTAPGQFNNDTGWFTRSHWGDVNNPRDNLWYKVIGPEYVELAFTFARRYAAPYVRLFYNDYNTFQADKTLAIVALLTELVEKGLVDGMGMQSAFGLNWPSSLSTGANSVRQAIEQFSALGLEIQMTEVTVRAGSPDFFEHQALRYQEFFEVVLEMHHLNGGPANITNVTLFGLMDSYKFYANFEQFYWLFDYRLQPKPAFYAVRGVVDSFS